MAGRFLLTADYPWRVQRNVCRARLVWLEPDLPEQLLRVDPVLLEHVGMELVVDFLGQLLLNLVGPLGAALLLQELHDLVLLRLHDCAPPYSDCCWWRVVGSTTASSWVNVTSWSPAPRSW